MSTRLRLKSQGKCKPESPKRSSPHHAHLEDCCRRQKETRLRRREYLSRRTKISATKLADKNVIDVIKSISGSSGSGSNNSLMTNGNDRKILRTESESSVIYTGTTYVKSEAPRKESVIDLTKSDTTIISWTNNFNLDDYDISGDNILDELFLKDQVSSAASIFTIFPPQPENLFSSPSDELCAYQTDHSCCLASNKRNLSAFDISCDTGSRKAKRVISNASRLSSNVNTNSLDCVWKLKKSYPLTNDLCENNDEDTRHGGNIDENEIDIFDIVQDLEKEFNLTQSQHSALAGELKALKVASILD